MSESISAEYEYKRQHMGFEQDTNIDVSKMGFQQDTTMDVSNLGFQHDTNMDVLKMGFQQDTNMNVSKMGFEQDTNMNVSKMECRQNTNIHVNSINRLKTSITSLTRIRCSIRRGVGNKSNSARSQAMMDGFPPSSCTCYQVRH